VEKPSIFGLVGIFREEFGYAKPAEKSKTTTSPDFEQLYSMDNPIVRGEEDWFLPTP